MDLVVKSERIPAVGETILGGDFIMTPGGKGANQAVAAVKLGAEVYFVAKLGDDIFSQQSLANFEKEAVKCDPKARGSFVREGVFDGFVVLVAGLVKAKIDPSPVASKRVLRRNPSTGF